MNLHRETLPCVEKLEKQGESRGGVIPVEFSEDLLPVVGPKLVQGFSLEGAEVYHALGLFPVNHLPEFPYCGAVGKWLAEQGLHPVTSPEAFHGQRLKENGR